MSALIVYFQNDFAVVAQDTLHYRIEDEKVIPHSFNNKIVCYPEFKSITAYIGYKQLSVDLSDFLRYEAIAKDVDGIISIIQSKFFNYLNLAKYSLNIVGKNIDVSVLGEISIIGYSEKESKLKYFAVSVDRMNVFVEEIKKENNLFMIPDIQNKSCKKEILSGSLSIKDKVTECMKVLHKESLDPSTHNAAIGGEVILTQIFTAPSCCFVTEITHRFDEFEEQYSFIGNLWN